jgi:hypothetical protein
MLSKTPTYETRKLNRIVHSNTSHPPPGLNSARDSFRHPVKAHEVKNAWEG